MYASFEGGGGGGWEFVMIDPTTCREMVVSEAVELGVCSGFHGVSVFARGQESILFSSRFFLSRGVHWPHPRVLTQVIN